MRKEQNWCCRKQNQQWGLIWEIHKEGREKSDKNDEKENGRYRRQEWSLRITNILGRGM